jgi:hypothetical protein
LIDYSRRRRRGHAFDGTAASLRQPRSAAFEGGAFYHSPRGQEMLSVGRWGTIFQLSLPAWVSGGSRNAGRDPTCVRIPQGCGDLFVGGCSGLGRQTTRFGKRQLELVDACAWGCASGGFVAVHGGSINEQAPGEKLSV